MLVQPLVVVESESEPSAISFTGALRIPVGSSRRRPMRNDVRRDSEPVLSPQGVIEFSLCLLFAKLVSYTFLFWLPLYITKAGDLQRNAGV